MSEDAERLAQLALFRHVPENSLVKVVRRTKVVEFAIGEQVYAEGSAADTALLVVSGRLEAQVGAPPRRVGDVAPGEVVGETALFVEGGRRSASIVATQPSRCLVIDRDLLIAGGKNSAIRALEHHLLGTLARRIRWTDQTIQKVWKETGQDSAGPSGQSSQTTSKPTTLRERLRGLLGGR